MLKAQKYFILIFILFSVLTGCCKRKAYKGIDVFVKDNSTNDPISDVQVFIHDNENSSNSGPLVDIGTTDSNGKVHLKLTTKCSHYLLITCGGNTDYFSMDFQNESKVTTKSLPKSITILLQHR